MSFTSTLIAVLSPTTASTARTIGAVNVASDRAKSLLSNVSLGTRFAISAIAPFHNPGFVPNRAFTVSAPHVSLAGAIYNHPRLSEAVGDATAAFCAAMLRGETDPGVWYPEEAGAVKDRARLLEAAAVGCDNYEMNKAARMLESKPINLGFGMYLEL